MRWHAAVRSALSKRVKRRDVLDGLMACWLAKDGHIGTAAGDQSRGWRAPLMTECADVGSWTPDPSAPAPCFNPDLHWADRGGNADLYTDEDDDEYGEGNESGDDDDSRQDSDGDEDSEAAGVVASVRSKSEGFVLVQTCI